MREPLPLHRYGVIGNGATVALVGCDGSIDWCCLPDLDRPSAFAALLDRERGGRFALAPLGAGRGTQRYVDGTNVLETRHAVGGGHVVVTDFVPVEGELARIGERLTPERRAALAAPEIHRLVRAEGTAATIALEWSPRYGYARGRTGIGALGAGAWLGASGTERAVLAGVPANAEASVDDTPALSARFALAAGEECAIVMRYGAERADAPLAESRRARDASIAAWRCWLAATGDAAWAGRHAGLVRRSALALKLLCFARTGAIAAAATTSLPEVIGGCRNWDYRYSWFRDSALTTEALLALGHPDEVHAYVNWACRVEQAVNEREPWLQLVFGLNGETELPEVELSHLAGYRQSAPVRIGNGIARHRGHDIYGQLLGAALEYASLGHTLDDEVKPFLAHVADTAVLEWDKPDFGFWEMKRGPLHYVHSKWSISRALDHALALHRHHGVAGDASGWRRARDAARARTLERGWNERRRAFVIAEGEDALDAANVLMPVLGFLPAADERVTATLDATLRELRRGDLCYRYRCDDGLPGDEGCFVACGFWLVEALVLAGRLGEARELFDGLAQHASPLGLYTEEIDPRDGTHLGNLPQALSHVGFVNALVRLAHAEGADVPMHPDPAGLDGDA